MIKWFLHKDAHLDWLKHLTLGTLFFIAVFVIMFKYNDDLHFCLTISNFATIGLGVLKELYDQFVKKKKGEAIDIIWTIVGGLIITLIIIGYGFI